MSHPSPRWPFHRLIWLVPAAYALHVCEEYAAGFPAWMTQTVGGPMTTTTFLAYNGVFIVLLATLTAWASVSRRALAAFLVLAWASGQMFWNFVFHLAMTVAYDRYSPGLVSAVLLYWPLSLLVWRSAWREGVVSRGRLAVAIAIGGGLTPLVIWAGPLNFRTW
jgi:hypothetical protein